MWRRPRPSTRTRYAHTAYELFRFDVNTLAVTRVGRWGGDALGVFPTDLAIDRFGVVYVTDGPDLFVCRPDTAACRRLGSAGVGANGLTFVPPGTLDPVRDVLVGMGGVQWTRVDRVGASFTVTPLGTFDDLGSFSSGDAFSIDGVGTFATITIDNRDTLVRLDPLTGRIEEELFAFTRGVQARQIWGLAGWIDGFIYAFAASGEVFQFDPATNDVRVAVATSNGWWGAGVRTIPAAP